MASEKEIEAAARAIESIGMSDGDPLGVAIAEYIGDLFCITADEVKTMLDGLMKSAASAALAAAEQVREQEAREARKQAESWPYGCHCDLAPGQKPDGCFLDWGESYIHNCTSAPKLYRERKPKTSCEYWRQYDPADYARAHDTEPK